MLCLEIWYLMTLVVLAGHLEEGTCPCPRVPLYLERGSSLVPSTAAQSTSLSEILLRLEKLELDAASSRDF